MRHDHKSPETHSFPFSKGSQTTDIHDDTFKSGRVAIQHHGKGGTHFFRNIKLRPLTLTDREPEPAPNGSIGKMWTILYCKPRP